MPETTLPDHVATIRASSESRSPTLHLHQRRAFARKALSAARIRAGCPCAAAHVQAAVAQFLGNLIEHVIILWGQALLRPPRVSIEVRPASRDGIGQAQPALKTLATGAYPLRGTRRHLGPSPAYAPLGDDPNVCARWGIEHPGQSASTRRHSPYIRKVTAFLEMGRSEKNPALLENAIISDFDEICIENMHLCCTSDVGTSPLSRPHEHAQVGKRECSASNRVLCRRRFSGRRSAGCDEQGAMVSR